jgi:serine/threonine protein kinase/tetratricopeptide (TPR) repeat protein
MHCPRCQSDNPEETRFCGRCGAALASSGSPAVSLTQIMAEPVLSGLAAGQTFAGRYQVIEDLGQGGMGHVYKVYDTEVREKMALKILNPEIASDERTIERFRGELRLARTIAHRNVCRMYDLGREGATYFITMEYVPGEDLKGLMHRIGALPVGKALSLARQIGEGLAEAHRAGVIHRDLKPQNIMIDRDGNARIMDFGIARSVKSKGITGANVLIGTPEYMSPEQVDGREAGPRSDLYSLGVVLFEMLTGRLPFEGETPLSVAVKQKSEAPPNPRTFNAHIPEDLARLILQCLEKTPEKRPSSAVELAARMAEIAAVLPASNTTLPLRRPATSKTFTVRLPSKKVWVPALVLMVLLGAFLAWQFLPGGEANRRSIAVMGFKNQTGDAAFDYLQETIPNLLVTSLEQSGRFRVTTWQELKDLLRRSGKEASAAFDDEVGFEICRQAGIETLAVGFFTKAGDSFVTDVKIFEAATKRALKTTQARGEGPASILKSQIDEISRSIIRGRGLAALKIEKAPPKIVDVTTSSLEAYSAYLRGRDEYDRFFTADARRSFEKAIALDPDFAVAHLYLARAFSALGDKKAQEEALERARRLAARASEKERLYIEASYAGSIKRDASEQRRILEELVSRYPGEKDAQCNLAVSYSTAREFPRALESFDKALALDPDFGRALNQAAYTYLKMGQPAKAVPYLERYAALKPDDPAPRDSLAEMLMRTGRLDDAIAKYKEVLAAYPDFYLSWKNLAYVYALQEKYPEALRCLDEMVARAPAGSAKLVGIWLRAFLLDFLGRRDRSLKEFQDLKAISEKGGDEYSLMTTSWMLVFVHLERGEFDEAEREIESFLGILIKRNPARPPMTEIIKTILRGRLAFARGRTETALAMMKETEALFAGLDPATREEMAFPWADTKAEALLAAGRAEDVIAARDKISLGILPGLQINDIASYNQPFLKDVLARAYGKKGDLDRAAAEYRKLLTIDPANQVRALMSPLYHYRLGRVLDEKGDRAGARAEYTRFLAGWKDADASHPELADARRRIATR